LTILEKLSKLWDGVQKEPRLALWDAVEEVERFDKYAKLLACPGCKQKGKFATTAFERGSKGWELQLICEACKTAGVLNNTGFRFVGLKERIERK